jgi:hypothetical protein
MTMPDIQQHLRDLENPIGDVKNMVDLCLVALDRAGTQYVGVPEDRLVKVTKENWALLAFVLNQAQDMATGLSTQYQGGFEVQS